MSKGTNKTKCQMTVGDNGQFDGVERYWECGRPAKFRMKDRLRGEIVICAMHANAYNRTAKRYKKPPLEPL